MSQLACVVHGMTNSKLQLARTLLSGYVERDKRKRLRSKYLKPESPEELKARQALAKLLRSNNPLDRQIRTFLANLVDPDPRQREPRTIRFVLRDKSQRVDPIANTQIAEYVRRLISADATVTEAIARTGDRFGLQKDRVMDIWSNYRPVYERIYGPLPRQRKGGR
jgi:hypothetical protein